MVLPLVIGALSAVPWIADQIGNFFTPTEEEEYEEYYADEFEEEEEEEDWWPFW